MFNLLEIKYYTVVVMNTFAQEPITDARKVNLVLPYNHTLLKYFEMECSA